MKLLGYLSKLMITAILLSTLSVMTTIYIVDQYVGVVLDRFHLSDIERPTLSVSDVLSSAQQAPPMIMEPKETTIEPQSQPQSESQSDPLTQMPSNRDDAADDPIHDVEAAPVFGHAIQSGSIVITADEFNEKRKNLSDEDKMAIFAIMMNKLPQAELQRLSEWLEDGITDEELTQVEEVINAYLEEDDIDRLLSILNRY